LLEVRMDFGEFNMFNLWATALAAMQAKLEEESKLIDMMRGLLGHTRMGSHAKAEDALGEIQGIHFWELLHIKVWVVVS
jgi:hypothetical protein